MRKRGAPVFVTWRALWPSDWASHFSDAPRTMMTRSRISAHFAAAEFDCRNGTEWPPAARAAIERWARMWGEPLRTRFGPVRVTSGYRTTAYNRSVGGAPDSFHVYTRRHPAAPAAVNVWDLAVDVVPARGTPADWQAWASATLRRGQQGFTASRGAAVAYPRQGFIHLDTGPRRTWAG